MGEIGAGILPVGIEEQRVQLGRQVVVMGDVALRAGDRVELGHRAEPPRRGHGRAQPPDRRHVFVVADDERDEPGDVVVLDRQVAVHVGLAHGELRMEREPALGLLAGQAHAERRRVPGPVGTGLSVGIGQVKPTRTHEVPKHPVQKRGPHSSHPSSLRGARINAGARAAVPKLTGHARPEIGGIRRNLARMTRSATP